MGTLPEAWLDQPLLDRALRRTLGRPTQRGGSAAGEALRYGNPAGDEALRQQVLTLLARQGKLAGFMEGSAMGAAARKPKVAGSR